MAPSAEELNHTHTHTHVLTHFSLAARQSCNLTAAAREITAGQHTHFVMVDRYTVNNTHVRTRMVTVEIWLLPHHQDDCPDLPAFDYTMNMCESASVSVYVSACHFLLACPAVISLPQGHLHCRVFYAPKPT